MNREDESTRNLLSRSSAYAPPPSTFKLPNRFVKSRKLQCITTALLFCFVLAAVWIFAPARSATYSQNYDARPPTNITRPTRPTRPTPPPPPPPQYLPDKPLHPKFRTGKGRHRGVINYTFGDGSAYEKPLDTKIYGLVFYGRWDRVQILDCYLKRNLASNGGFLDKVIFVVNTRNAEDLEALEKILASEPDWYDTLQAKPTEDRFNFEHAWEGLEPDVLYIKMDDDVVFIQDDAIPSMTRFRMNQPRHFIISANVINHPEISYLHWRLGAVQPFLPEQTPPEGFSPTDPISDWRTSNLPFIKHFNNSDYDWVEPEAPHRWLPVDTRTGIPSDVTLDYTPISTSTYDEFGSGWNDWRLSAQQHYSFFQNAEEGEQGLKNYKFGGWDMNYGRLSINFIAIWGRDVLASFPMPNDDEKHLTQTMSKRSGRHVFVDGKALVAHYSFAVQREGLEKTDILQRYKAFAKDYCGKLLDD